jgi:hypothetical protein
LPYHLGSKRSPIKFGDQGLRKIRGIQLAMKESLFHHLDYNRELRSTSTVSHIIKRFWSHNSRQLALALIIAGFLSAGERLAVAQTAVPATETPTPGGPSPYVTNNYIEPVNVRAGPSSLYDALGNLPVGASVQALGVSPHHEWIQIAYQGSADGTGWVYAPFVELSPGYLKVVEPPPTPMPLASATIDPTFAAAFQVSPTLTRLPTFTPPPPLEIPTFVASSAPAPGFQAGTTILALALVGGLVLMASFLGRR